MSKDRTIIDPEALEPLTQAAQAIAQRQTPVDVLQEIVEQASRCILEFQHVSVSRIRPDRRLETLAATTALARRFDEAQSEAQGGPCIEAGRLDEVVLVNHARHEQRWPAYMQAAIRLGLRSQLGIQLISDTAGAICLNLHSTTDDDLDPGSVGVAEHFAVQAGIALGHLRASDQLRTAIGTRTSIGTAIGITMERYGLTHEQAFQYLVRQASEQNRKVRVIAKELVDAADLAVAPDSEGSDE